MTKQVLPELNDQLKHYSQQLKRPEPDISKEIEEFGKTRPGITDKALLAHVWGFEKGISLQLRTVIPGTSEKFFLIQNLDSMAKKGIKSVNVRGYVIAERFSQKGNPRVVLIDESGLVEILIQDKEKWTNLGLKIGDPIYIEQLNIWQPVATEERYVYTVGQLYSAISKVTNNDELKMPLWSDIAATPINDLSPDTFVFVNGFMTGARETTYNGCSACRKKTTVAEGQMFDCQKCGKNGVISKKNRIKQMAFSDNSGGYIMCTLPPTMESVNLDLYKGLQLGLIGNTKQTDGEISLRIISIMKPQDNKTLDQQYKNASEIAIKFIDLQPNFTVKKEEFVTWLKTRFGSLSSEDLVLYMIKNNIVAENGAFINKK